MGLAHVFDELISPGLEDGAGLAVMAVRDRPWPPWGIGAQSISALTFIHPIGEGRAGLANVLAVPEEEMSIGLLAAVYREGLNLLAERSTNRIHLVAREETFLAGRVLASTGFTKTSHQYITETARYYLHEADVNTHLAALGIADRTPLQLLGNDFTGSALEKVALFLLTLNASFTAFWKESARAPELIPNLAVARVAECLPPGGPPDEDPLGSRT
jgi:hypothetical protein